MSPEEKLDPKEAERRKLLEEIRRRAEEAELRRIESEEEKTGLSTALERERPATREPAPVITDDVEPPATAPTRKKPPQDEHRLIDLRGRFAVAIDHHDLEEASDLILEIAGLIPGSVELNSYQEKLRSLRRKLREQRETPLAPTPPPSPPPDDAPTDRKRQSRDKKISALLEESISLYEQEKYGKAASTVRDLLEIDPEHDEAAELRGKIQKAQELAAEVREEEERRRAEEVATRPAGWEEEPEPVPEPKGDFWGSETSRRDDEYGIEVDEVATPKVPRVPITRQITERVSKIRIPVKPVLTVAVMVLAIVGGYFLAGEIQQAAGEMTSSVLVLPGWHTPSDSIAEVLSYALLEQIADRLTSVPDLRVIGPRSASTVQYVRGGPAGAARTLGVEHYLHWTIRTTPASVGLELTLRDTAGADPLWTQQKQSSIRELPGTMNEIAGSILQAMELLPENEQPGAAQAGMSSDPDALLRYFQGRFMLGNPDRYAVGRAGSQFDEALRIDPGFRLAKVSKAWTLLLEAESSSGLNPTLVDDAERLLGNAGNEGATAPEHLAAIGLMEQFQGRFEKAKSFFDMGVSYFPVDAELLRRSAMVDIIRGDEDAGRSSAKKAASLDPLNIESWMTLAMVEKFSGHPEDALRYYHKAAGLSTDRKAFSVKYLPEVLVSVQRHDSAEALLTDEIARSRDDFLLHYRLGRVLQAAGKPIAQWEQQFGRARTLLERTLAASPGDGVARSYLALVLTRLGKQKEAEVELNRSLRDRRNHPIVLYNAARAYTMQRNYESAVEYLDKAISVWYDPELITDMDFYNLKDHSDFLAVVIR